MDLRPSGTAHILLDERGRGWIDDTNIKVIEVVLDKLAWGMSPEEIHTEYPPLSLAQIHAAFSWYYDHQAEYDEEIERQKCLADELRAASLDSPVRQKLRAGQDLMTVPLYVDVHVHAGITAGLRQRAVVVLAAQEDGADRFSDPDLLDRATALGYVFFSNDTDFLVEAARRQRAGEHFAGLVYAHPANVSIGQRIDDLELIAKVNDPPDMADRVEHLPL